MRQKALFPWLISAVDCAELAQAAEIAPEDVFLCGRRLKARIFGAEVVRFDFRHARF